MSSKDSKAPINGFWSPLRIVATIIVLALFAAFGVSSCNSNDPSPATTSSAPNSPQQTASPGLSALPPPVLQAQLRSANGAQLKLSDYSGKVMLVNLWATWCGPCRIETPELVRLNKEFQSRGVEIVGLSTEDPDASAQSVRQFVKDNNVDYHIGWATPEVAAILMQGSGSIPQSFIITRDGRILRRFIGFHPQLTPPQIRAALEQALNYTG
jgi:thiol-disulfide isomerase/thioredoxin